MRRNLCRPATGASRRIRVAASVLLILAIAPAHAAATMSEDEARARAVKVLKGSDYGESQIDVLNHIKQIQLLTKGSNECGAIGKPVWAFRIETPYKGSLYLDAVSGEKACSSLPFFR